MPVCTAARATAVSAALSAGMLAGMAATPVTSADLDRADPAPPAHTRAALDAGSRAARTAETPNP